MKTLQGELAVSNLRRLIKAQDGEKTTLKPIEPKGRQEARKGRSDFREDQQPRGSGLASPLIEEDYSTRERWPARTFGSVDGILSFRSSPIRVTHQVDANGEEVVNEWAARA